MSIATNVIPIPLPKPPAELLVPHSPEGSHWYDRRGIPVYEIVGKNGKPRPTTVRDGRKLDLVPSFSTVSQCAAQPGLERWKREQLLYASLTLPRVEGETEEAFARRVVEDAEQQGLKARDTGSAIHDAIEKCLCGKPYDAKHKDFVDGALGALDEWCGLDGIKPEKSFAHPLGYGGKTDVHKVTPEFIADFQSKDFGPDNLPKIYDNHPMQLAAYREGFGIPNARGAIIFVSTRVPGLTHLVEIDEDELARGWNMFVKLLEFWQLKNRYNSSF